MPRPELACCRPRMVPGPSGWAWNHSDYCPRWPRQKVGRERLPVPTSGRAAAEIWRRHPPGHACPACAYTDAHLDDADDERGRNGDGA